jgi:hypothetical protein
MEFPLAIRRALPSDGPGIVNIGRRADFRCTIRPMAHVLVSLRIPSLMLKSADGSASRRVDNSALRFMKTVELAAIPKAGAILELTASAVSAAFGCRVKQADWDERTSMFVVSCSYTQPSIPETDYRALLGSSDWVMKPLL